MLIWLSLWLWPCLILLFEKPVKPLCVLQCQFSPARITSNSHSRVRQGLSVCQPYSTSHWHWDHSTSDGTPTQIRGGHFRPSSRCYSRRTASSRLTFPHVEKRYCRYLPLPGAFGARGPYSPAAQECPVHLCWRICICWRSCLPCWSLLALSTCFADSRKCWMWRQQNVHRNQEKCTDQRSWSRTVTIACYPLNSVSQSFEPEIQYMSNWNCYQGLRLEWESLVDKDIELDAVGYQLSLHSCSLVVKVLSSYG